MFPDHRKTATDDSAATLQSRDHAQTASDPVARISIVGVAQVLAYRSPEATAASSRTTSGSTTTEQTSAYAKWGQEASCRLEDVVLLEPVVDTLGEAE